jgi:hypothetical protein
MYGAGTRAATAYNSDVNPKFFKGVARVTRSFRVDIGPVRAQGVPAILLGLGGLVLAAGVARAVMRSSDRLPETLREARSLTLALRGDAPRLGS